MKKLLFGILTVALASCSSPEKEVKSLIESKLKTSMNDWGSYEFVEMGTIDSVLSDCKLEPEYISLKQSQSEILRKKVNVEVSSQYPSLYGAARCKEMADSIPLMENLLNETTAKLKAYSANYKGKLTGWKVTFTYRGNNKLGAKTIANTEFYLDIDRKKIIDAKDIETNL